MSSEALNQRFLHLSKKSLTASLICHGVVLALFGVGEILAHYDLLPFQKKPPKHEMVQEFIQVDMVGLPDMMIKDLDKIDMTQPIVDKPNQAVEEAKPEPDEMEHADEAKAKELEKEAAEKKKAAEDQARRAKQKAEQEKALKKLQEEAKREAALKALAKKEGTKSGRQKMAGNIVSKGTSAKGNIGALRDKFSSLIGQRIKQHFNIFFWQQKKGLSSVVAIEFYNNGRVKSRKIMKKSIDPLYDSAVLQAIDEAQPFPAPDDLSLLKETFLVEFRPE